MKELHPDHDTHWKELIEKRSWNTIAFFLPRIYAIADQSKGVEFLDKELHKLIADKFKGGNTRKDKLAKIYLKNGKEHYVLIHFEVQAKFDKEFLRRMFVYFYRIFDKREENITALVIYTGDSVPEDCDTFQYEFMGTSVVYKFNVYRVCDADETELLKDDNPMALAVLAAKYLNATKNDKELRYAFKHKLMDLALERGWTDDKIDSLLQFIYLLIILPNNLETKFEEESRTKYNIMSTTVKRKIPLIEDIMKKYRSIQAEAKRTASVESAKKMLKMIDVSVEQVAEIQDLPIDVVIELQKEIESET